MRKIEIIAAITIVVVVAGISVLCSKQKHFLSEVALANIEALANPEESGYSCSATANCYFGGRVEGSVSCSGTVSCISGYEYVICDGRTSYCL